MDLKKLAKSTFDVRFKDFKRLLISDRNPPQEDWGISNLLAIWLSKFVYHNKPLKFESLKNLNQRQMGVKKIKVCTFNENSKNV